MNESEPFYSYPIDNRHTTKFLLTQVLDFMNIVGIFCSCSCNSGISSGVLGQQVSWLICVNALYLIDLLCRGAMNSLYMWGEGQKDLAQTNISYCINTKPTTFHQSSSHCCHLTAAIWELSKLSASLLIVVSLLFFLLPSSFSFFFLILLFLRTQT